ncbi:MAG: TatD family hydrolase [Verrucomicrobiota bacterium]|nr:TatD family hydrolase [Verrucomicrobiota bacterium]
MFDTHLHIYKEDDFEKIYNDATAHGVRAMLLVGTDYEDSAFLSELCKPYKNVYSSVGVHPHEADKYVNADLNNFKKLVEENDKIKAIGEVGLDFYYSHSNEENQILIFKKFINIANSLSLPVIVHCRDAYEALWKILNEKPPEKFLIHSFTGTTEWAEKYISMGAYFSFNGIMTFKKAQNVRDVFSVIPEDKFFAETDSPYLAPTPFRGKKNNPSYIAKIIECIATERNWSMGKTIDITTSNAKSFFDVTIQ